jgi:signal transduction histidine kinase
MIKSSMLFLFLFSVALAFVAGSLALQLRASDEPAFDLSGAHINALKRRFRERTPVAAELNVENLFAVGGAAELSDPRKTLNPHGRRSFAQTAKLFKALKRCEPGLISGAEFAKARLWISFRCGQRQRLPVHFFDEGPYLFPTGVSYALLAYQTGDPAFTDVTWLREHVPAFHALELRLLPKAVDLDVPHRLLAGLEAGTLVPMIDGQEWVLDSSHVLVRRTTRVGESIGIREDRSVDYLVYPRGPFDELLGREHLAARAAGSFCAYREDGLCWFSVPAPTTVKIRWTVGALLLLTLGLIGFCVVLILKTLRRQKLEEQQKRFALQALTHELRTPLASLMFSSERLMQQFESLPPSAQQPFLLIFDDVQRLARVAKSSQHYLGASPASGVVPLTPENIPSLNEYVTMVLARFEGSIDFSPLAEDRSVTADRYWLGVCMQNLVQNSCQHGIQPVLVRLEFRESGVVFSVTDAGTLPATNSATVRRELLAPFRKGAASTGLGLGLTIVDTVATAMGGQLKVFFKPTKFELWIEANR